MKRYTWAILATTVAAGVIVYAQADGASADVSATATAPALADFLQLPPISVTASDATFEEALAALRKAMGTPKKIQNLGDESNRKFTLKANNSSFWEIVKSLEYQCPMEIAPGNDFGGLGLYAKAKGTGVYDFQCHGPAMLYASGIRLVRQIDGQQKADAHGEAKYELRLNTAVDPRIAISLVDGIEVRQAVDETGRKIAMPPWQKGGWKSTSNFWGWTVNFTAPEPPPERISMRCVTHFTVFAPEKTATLEGEALKKQATVTVGTRQLRLTDYYISGENMYLELAAIDPEPPRSPVYLRLSDANGRTNYYAGHTGIQVWFWLGKTTPPYTLTFYDGDPTKEAALEFELKDIPLP